MILEENSNDVAHPQLLALSIEGNRKKTWILAFQLSGIEWCRATQENLFQKETWSTEEKG